jgi:hypothetical protein
MGGTDVLKYGMLPSRQFSRLEAYNEDGGSVHGHYL